MKGIRKLLLSIVILIFALSSTAPATIAMTPTAKPSTFCFDAFKVVKTKKYGKLKCLAFRTPRGMVWIWTRV